MLCIMFVSQMDYTGVAVMVAVVHAAFSLGTSMRIGISGIGSSNTYFIVSLGSISYNVAFNLPSLFPCDAHATTRLLHGHRMGVAWK